MRLRIGEFARLGFVSVSALRFYDDAGLFKPAEVDPWTGYRYYSYDQLGMLHRLLALKDLGLSLDEIRQLLGAELPAEKIREMLVQKRVLLKGQAQEISEQIARVEARIEQIESEGKMPDYDVVVKKVERIPVALLKDILPNMEVIGTTFNRLFNEATGEVVLRHGEVNGAPIALFYNDMMSQPGDWEIGVALPTASKFHDGDRVKLSELPAVESMACVVHKGSFANLGQAYAAAGQWIDEGGYRVVGPSREVYLQYDREGDPADWVTEVQFPVER